MQIFPYFADPFDPEEQKEYTFRFNLLSGESIVSSVIEQVDATSTTVISPSDLVFGPKTMGAISGSIWGVTQWLLPCLTTPSLSTAFLRCVITTDYAGPIAHVYSRTMRLSVRQG